eukprot:TRINITY_DN2599_c0_g1_i2.p1 TRINITY_DN2599_c0_g1~~TRINITY_DN2599_c0_g1_i2.p1  ORF type:complete len:179 (+),score=36.82 TRINITY_DN2599_c0_g1_i2:525-1061(+)
MSFPQNEPQIVHFSTDLREQIAQIFGIEEIDILRDEGGGGFLYCSRTKKLVVLVKSEAVLRSAHIPGPDIMKLPFPCDVRGVSLATSLLLSTELVDFDFASRYFSQWNGLDEDPVNGSSHTVMAPLFAKRLGKQTLKAAIVSERGGMIMLENDNELHRVLLKGRACSVLKGTFMFNNT